MSTQPIPEPQRRRGFTPFPNDVLLDWPRLLSGNAQVFTLMYINSETTGAARDPKTKPPYWSRPITIEEFAAFARCSVRAIQLAVNDAVDRKVIERKASFHGASRYHIPFETWAKLPDRPTNVIPISEAEEPEENPPEDESKRVGALPVFSKPQRLRGGARPRPKELPAAASKLRVTSDAEIEYTGTVCDGILFLEFKVPKGERVASEKRNIFRSDSDKSNKLNNSVISDPLFSELELAARKAGLSHSPTDLAKAYQQWTKLDAGEQRAAIRGLADRHAAGEFDNATFIPLVQNYLKNKTWHRAVRRPASKADAKLESRRRNYEEARRMILEDERRKAGRS